MDEQIQTELIERVASARNVLRHAAALREDCEDRGFKSLLAEHLEEIAAQNLNCAEDALCRFREWSKTA